MYTYLSEGSKAFRRLGLYQAIFRQHLFYYRVIYLCTVGVSLVVLYYKPCRVSATMPVSTYDVAVKACVEKSWQESLAIFPYHLSDVGSVVLRPVCRHCSVSLNLES